MSWRVMPGTAFKRRIIIASEAWPSSNRFSVSAECGRACPEAFKSYQSFLEHGWPIADMPRYLRRGADRAAASMARSAASKVGSGSDIGGRATIRYRVSRRSGAVGAGVRLHGTAPAPGLVKMRSSSRAACKPPSSRRVSPRSSEPGRWPACSRGPRSARRAECRPCPGRPA